MHCYWRTDCLIEFPFGIVFIFVLFFLRYLMKCRCHPIRFRRFVVGWRLDFIISTDPMESLGGVERHTIMREPFLLVLPERMAKNIPNPGLENLARNHPFVGYSVRSMIGDSIENYLVREGINVGDSLQFDGTEAVFAMVSAGLGWAITTPLCLIHGFAHMPTLSAMPLPGRSLSRTLYLVAREGEFGTLPKRIAKDARATAQGLIEKRVSKLAPWAVDEMSVG